MNINDSEFWYLATMFTKHPDGFEKAARDAAVWSADLLRHGIVVYSPIVHSWQLAKFGKLPATDYSIWKAADKPFVVAAKGMIVATEPACWRESTGINDEIEVFTKAGKPIHYWNPTHAPSFKVGT